MGKDLRFQSRKSRRGYVGLRYPLGLRGMDVVANHQNYSFGVEITDF
jgi:hypothetical protein